MSDKKRTKDVQEIIMKPIKGVVILSRERGHLYNILGKDSISARGFVHLAKVAGISIVIPTPYIERNPKIKNIETITIKPQKK